MKTEYFTDKERAALELVDAIRLVSVGQVLDSVYEQTTMVLSEAEVSPVEYFAIELQS